MEMLSDPSIAAEVEAMMKDPAFQVGAIVAALGAPIILLFFFVCTLGGSAVKAPVSILSCPPLRSTQNHRHPHHQAEMRRITNSPLFKDALEQAKEMTAELQADPAKMQHFMQDLQKEMGNFAAAAAGGNKAAGRVGAGGRAEL